MFSDTFRTPPRLRKRLSKWLRQAPAAVSEPLLDRDEIIALRAATRISSPFVDFNPREIKAQLHGDRRSVYRGAGLDYEESRQYVQGDDVRHMNWRLTARYSAPYMKVFREERHPSAFIVIDRRPAMRFGSRRRLKVAQAVRAAAIHAFAAADRGAAVGGLIVETPLRWSPVRAGQAGALDLIRAAAAPCPPTVSQADTPTLGHVVRLVETVAPPGSDVILISDFFALNNSDLPALLRLANTCSVRAVEILDAAELDLPRAGRIWLETAAGDEIVFINTADPATASAYANAAEQQFAHHRRILRRADIPVQRLMNDTDLDSRAIQATVL